MNDREKYIEELKATFMTKDDFYHPQHGIIAHMNRNFRWLLAVMISMFLLLVLIVVL